MSMRRAGRVLVWLVIGLCLIEDADFIQCLFGYSCVLTFGRDWVGRPSWISTGVFAIAQSLLVWAEIRLRPRRPPLTIRS